MRERVAPFFSTTAAPLSIGLRNAGATAVSPSHPFRAPARHPRTHRATRIAAPRAYPFSAIAMLAGPRIPA
ncbi:hypothetical protein WT60_04730 [Burkholderia sp. MSMB617WGS]|uniref:Uncharacterized protein n=1 Tax=Burkholderia savannae TaxID=1637837 RepID=A0ABR5TF68_9BURK|nr:hypothetical protein WS86_04755 [Burkholderia savannae]AOK46235.1 hypothetical protein WT60_04730 [Burkholderia sp. MSMB617WGS]KWZ42207.1 hypothetical protein WS72_04460 [Burkholderia savannae]KWZ45276.1 hypothetical protein WS73_13805 [Burkholderia savannae]